VNTEAKHTPNREDVMRLVCLRSIPLALILLGGCATHPLRCDAHLTPINAPEPPASTAGVKPSEAGSP
jgi:hypothetical protein